MMQCWPDGLVKWNEDSGEALCSTNAIDPAEGRKSFPSGEPSPQGWPYRLVNWHEQIMWRSMVW